MQNLLQNIMGKHHSDNKSLVDAIYTSNSISDKRLRVDIAYIREFIQNKKVEKLVWIPTKAQLADCLTKPKSSSSQLLLNAMSQMSLESVFREVQLAL